MKRPFRSLRISLASTTCLAAAAHASPDLVTAVPDSWRAGVAAACGRTELYFSDHVGFRKLLMLGADGRYRLLYWSDDKAEREYSGTYERSAQQVRLRLKLGTDSLGSDANDAELVPMHLGREPLLLLRTELESIGANIQWNGHLGGGEGYYVQAACDRPAPVLAGDDLEGPLAPPYAELPPALQRHVFARPVTARIAAVLGDTGAYDYAASDGEILVRIDKGEKDGFRINMPLCSPKGSGARWHGWVGEAGAESSKMRIVIDEPRKGRPFRFPKAGETLVTSKAMCDDAKR